MGTAKSRMKKVAPASVTEEHVCNSDSHRDGQLFGPSNTASIRRARGDCNSDGQESEFSAEDLAVEVDRILEECDNTDIALNRTSYKIPIFGSKPSGLYYPKTQDRNNVYSGDKHGLYVTSGEFKDNNKVNSLNKPASNIHEKVRPPKDLLSCANIQSTATALGYGIGGGSSLPLPIMYDASEEDLMNVIESEFT